MPKWNELGLETIKNTAPVARVGDLVWSESPMSMGEDFLFTAWLGGLSRLTVLDRQTGFMDRRRDVETGFADVGGRFWLASGMQDIREFPDLTPEQAVEWVKERANNCRGE